MLNFDYSIPTEVFFGRDQIEVLGREASKYAKNVLVVYGGGSIKRSGLYDKAIALLKEQDINIWELPNVAPNPRIESVLLGIELCRKNSIDMIIGIGGGSVIDCSKVIGAGYYYDGDPWEIVVDPSKITNSLPIAAVITLSATGSEMDDSAVISNTQTNEKYGTHHPSMLPKFSILDPTYTFTVPINQTKAGIADILCHICEVYFSITTSAYIQNRLAEGVMKTCIHYAPQVIAKPDDYDSRANIMWASSLAINGLLSYGKISEWTMHAMEHELSAFYDITHGDGLAILMPKWMEYALNDDTKDKFAEYAHNVWGVEYSDDKMKMARAGIEKTKEFLYNTLGLPSTLKEVGIGDENLEKMSKKAVSRSKKGVIGHFCKLTPDDILKIYKMCL